MIKNIGGGDVAVEVAVEVINKVGGDGLLVKIVNLFKRFYKKIKLNNKS